MPFGVLVNCASVLGGGLLGGLLGRAIPQRLKDALPVVLGFAAMSMGIVKIIELQDMTVVVLSVIVGAIIGEVFDIKQGLDNGAKRLIGRFGKGGDADPDKLLFVSIAMVTFCFSGAGMFGALNEGMNGDSSMLLGKSALDFFTAFIFASVAGFAIAVVSIPQLGLLLVLFFAARFISPAMTPFVVANFNGVGGVVTLITGATVAGLAPKAKPANVVPALLVVILLSLVWPVA